MVCYSFTPPHVTPRAADLRAAVANAVMIARIEGDISGPEADTLAALMLAALQSGAVGLKIEVLP